MGDYILNYFPVAIVRRKACQKLILGHDLLLLSEDAPLSQKPVDDWLNLPRRYSQLSREHYQ
jgi:hypothetical protein